MLMTDQHDAAAIPDTVKFRVTGDRTAVKAMIDALDPIVDIVTDWRIFPQRNGTSVSAYLEARTCAHEDDSTSAGEDTEGGA
ncbi:hypothetical protein K7711_31945 [Nocardia sp. CA2R105]|uniref:hypothetical protein n=1 Tax=Nocardia coffeae TaxID=2873381 RepID=UPI001CA6634E|nr:hypothetical protein [Nocardia coffeae]MBY8861127.1 hypothetical protein [Nocardia coffeae]